MGADQDLPESIEGGLEGQKVGGLVIDQEDPGVRDGTRVVGGGDFFLHVRIRVSVNGGSSGGQSARHFPSPPGLSAGACVGLASAGPRFSVSTASNSSRSARLTGFTRWPSHP